MSVIGGVKGGVVGTMTVGDAVVSVTVIVGAKVVGSVKVGG